MAQQLAKARKGNAMRIDAQTKLLLKLLSSYRATFGRPFAPFHCYGEMDQTRPDTTCAAPDRLGILGLSMVEIILPVNRWRKHNVRACGSWAHTP